MKHKYLLSIVIPTKNRQEFILKTIDEILEVTSNNVQIVIQDNSDKNTLEKTIVSMNKSNITYQYSKEELSFVNNFNLAVDLTEGEYVCLIGDDDGVIDDMEEVIRWAMVNNIDAIVPSILVEYFYPNSIHFKNTESNGVIRILCKKLNVKKFDAKANVEKFLKNGCTEYYNYDLVKLYHGVVKKDKLLEIKKITGNYFGGLTPDIYSAIALSLVCDRTIKLQFPLTIAGVCKGSGSANSSNGLHIGKYEEAPHLKGHDNYEWSKLVPKFYSVDTIWAETSLQAIIDMNQQSLLKFYNQKKFTRICYYKYGDFRSKYIDVVECSGSNKEKLLIKIKNIPYSYLYKRVMKRLGRINNSLLIKNDICDIVAANHIFKSVKNEFLGSKDIISFLDCNKDKF